jgi:GntR family transcriptional regulator, transcriptional repressor for pyruvate dehydrogenase complex
MTKFTPIRQSRVSEKVGKQLKQSIILGYFKAGDKLPSERDLAEQFQVSRVAVHEALRSLEMAGFIVTRQGPMGGCYITDLTFESSVNAFQDLFIAEKISIEEVHQVRSVIESEIARLAALNVNAAYAERLRESVSTEDIPVESLSEDIARKMEVHFILGEMCGNRFLEALERSLMGLIKIAVETMSREAGSGHDLLGLHPRGMHQAIIEAVIAGDAEAAAEAAKIHATQYGENLRRAEKEYRGKKADIPSSFAR